METLGRKTKELLSRPEVIEGLRSLLNSEPTTPPETSVDVSNGDKAPRIRLRIESPK